MDISYVTGEEVLEQVEELSRKLMRATLTAERSTEKLHTSPSATRVSTSSTSNRCFSDREEIEDELLDPAALLIVMERLSGLCDGIAFDPQSDSFM